MAFALIFVVLVAFAVIVGLAILIGVGLNRNSRAARQHHTPRQRADASVIDKRTEVVGGGEQPTHQYYFATFQFPDGSRIELNLSGPESGLLAIGDSGVVEWQGGRYLSFAREILR